MMQVVQPFGSTARLLGATPVENVCHQLLCVCPSESLYLSTQTRTHTHTHTHTHFLIALCLGVLQPYLEKAGIAWLEARAVLEQATVVPKDALIQYRHSGDPSLVVNMLVEHFKPTSEHGTFR